MVRRVVQLGSDTYGRFRRCEEAWWLPRSSKPTWPGTSARRVRFPSASAKLSRSGSRRLRVHRHDPGPAAAGAADLDRQGEDREARRPGKLLQVAQHLDLRELLLASEQVRLPQLRPVSRPGLGDHYVERPIDAPRVDADQPDAAVHEVLRSVATQPGVYPVVPGFVEVGARTGPDQRDVVRLEVVAQPFEFRRDVGLPDTLPGTL